MKTRLILYCWAYAVLLLSCEGNDTKKQRFLKKGNLKFAQTDYKNAARFYKEALKLDSGFADAHYNLALVHKKTGNPDQSVFHLTQALQHSSQDSRYLLARSQVYLDQKFYHQAQQDAEKAIMSDTQNAAGYLLKGIAQNSLKKYTEAANSFSLGLLQTKEDIESDNEIRSDLLSNLAAVQLQSGDYSKAISTAEQAVTENPKQASALNISGMAQLYIGKYEDALDKFNQALEIDGKSSYYNNNKGEVLLELNRLEEALKHINYGIVYDPGNAQAYLNKAMYYWKLKDTAQAKSLAEKSLKVSPDNQKAQRLLQKIAKQ
ncbi:MAG: tetratricopeptide repeat protein [Cytophagales bacterium]|nr:tetratricopeptide repeat protein [Cytophagales bacterium]